MGQRVRGHDGRMRTSQPDQEDDSSHLESTGQSKESELEMARVFNLLKLVFISMLLPTRLHLQSIPKYHPQLRTNNSNGRDYEVHFSETHHSLQNNRFS